MSDLSSWVNNPNRNFKEGVTIYHKYKISSKHDAFFNTNTPGDIQMNMLYNQMCKALHREKQKPGYVEEVTTPEPIRVRKIEPKTVKKAEPTPDDTPVNLRSSKLYVNKLLALSFSDLSFNDKLIFFNSESYFLQKKTLFFANSDIEKETRSLHSKVKAIDSDPKFDNDRKTIMEKLSNLETTRTENWKTIDMWNEPEEFEGDIVAKAIQNALETEKKIKANYIYIYRAENDLPKMPDKTPNQKRKIEKKLAEIAKRKAELIAFGKPYESSDE